MSRFQSALSQWLSVGMNILWQPGHQQCSREIVHLCVCPLVWYMEYSPRSIRSQCCVYSARFSLNTMRGNSYKKVSKGSSILTTHTAIEILGITDHFLFQMMTNMNGLWRHVGKDGMNMLDTSLNQQFNSISKC